MCRKNQRKGRPKHEGGEGGGGEGGGNVEKDPLVSSQPGSPPANVTAHPPSVMMKLWQPRHIRRTTADLHELDVCLTVYDQSVRERL